MISENRIVLWERDNALAFGVTFLLCIRKFLSLDVIEGTCESLETISSLIDTDKLQKKKYRFVINISCSCRFYFNAGQAAM